MVSHSSPILIHIVGLNNNMILIFNLTYYTYIRVILFKRDILKVLQIHLYQLIFFFNNAYYYGNLGTHVYYIKSI